MVGENFHCGKNQQEISKNMVDVREMAKAIFSYRVLILKKLKVVVQYRYRQYRQYHRRVQMLHKQMMLFHSIKMKSRAEHTI